MYVRNKCAYFHLVAFCMLKVANYYPINLLLRFRSIHAIFVKTEINFFLYALQIFLLAFGNHSHLFTQPVYVHMWTSWTFQLSLLFLLHRVWKDEKFNEKKFRQINYLLISLVIPLLSRNFCQKCVTA